ncbi:MAG: aminotransferase class I/II-fold pyridoxal phosphate-dependent enzyme [Calditrichaeota bacterium]|nr:MAG: aminotransferase class I/II-fold pyridoxal phosphate-dependent enzyme [Calditrichota bacterium]
MRLSKLAQGIETSPIITLAAAINEKIQRGERFFNLTIGDFNPHIFPIPEELTEEVIKAYRDGHTNYPGAVGQPVLREAVSEFLKTYGQMNYPPENILIGSGGRPLIYATYKTIVNPGEKVIFPVPSWNNDYYTYLTGAEPVILETEAENYFMPTAAAIEPHIQDAALISLCSPLNPTGTVLSQSDLSEICDLVIRENRRRGSHQKPVYVFFDQIYWLLTHGETQHHTPVTVNPEMAEYTIFMDGMSKAFAGTGIRVGWAFAPSDVLSKMRTIVAHMGAWAPKPEQIASGNYLKQTEVVEKFLNHFRKELQKRLEGFYQGFVSLREKGHKVNAIAPQAAMYLTVQLDLVGATTSDGTRLESNEAVHRYILDEAKIGLVPFSYFGASRESNWYRLSVGTCALEEVSEILTNLENALNKLQY